MNYGNTRLNVTSRRVAIRLVYTNRKCNHRWGGRYVASAVNKRLNGNRVEKLLEMKAFNSISEGT